MKLIDGGPEALGERQEIKNRKGVGETNMGRGYGETNRLAMLTPPQNVYYFSSIK